MLDTCVESFLSNVKVKHLVSVANDEANPCVKSLGDVEVQRCVQVTNRVRVQEKSSFHTLKQGWETHQNLQSVSMIVMSIMREEVEKEI